MTRHRKPYSTRGPVTLSAPGQLRGRFPPDTAPSLKAERLALVRGWYEDGYRCKDMAKALGLTKPAVSRIHCGGERTVNRPTPVAPANLRGSFQARYYHDAGLLRERWRLVQRWRRDGYSVQEIGKSLKVSTGSVSRIVAQEIPKYYDNLYPAVS